VPYPDSADPEVRLQQRQAHSFRAGDTPFGQFCSGIAEGRGVSNNSAKRAARGIRSPFADRDLAEHGARRSGAVLKFGRDLMCRSNTHAPASQLVGPFGNRQREAGAQSLVHGDRLVRILL